VSVALTGEGRQRQVVALVVGEQQEAPMILIEASLVPATGLEPVTQGL
jgi:hypothetical protein